MPEGRLDSLIIFRAERSGVTASASHFARAVIATSRSGPRRGNREAAQPAVGPACVCAVGSAGETPTLLIAPTFVCVVFWV